MSKYLWAVLFAFSTLEVFTGHLFGLIGMWVFGMFFYGAWNDDINNYDSES